MFYKSSDHKYWQSCSFNCMRLKSGMYVYNGVMYQNVNRASSGEGNEN